MIKFVRDTGHLWLLFLLIGLALSGAAALRERMIPATYGDQGPYRAAALEEIASRPSTFPEMETCHQCHEDVHEERAESLHATVHCAHCHGLGREHVRLARQAEEGADVTVPLAEEWDGDFQTTLDLYISHDRKTCLVCHEAVVGMPEDFKKIRLAEHLDEMGASDPEARDTCFECHGNHDTAP